MTSLPFFDTSFLTDIEIQAIGWILLLIASGFGIGSIVGWFRSKDDYMRDKND